VNNKFLEDLYEFEDYKNVIANHNKENPEKVTFKKIEKKNFQMLLLLSQKRPFQHLMISFTITKKVIS
jgi:hypothetical protein